MDYTGNYRVFYDSLLESQLDDPVVKALRLWNDWMQEAKRGNFHYWLNDRSYDLVENYESVKSALQHCPKMHEFFLMAKAYMEVPKPFAEPEDYHASWSRDELIAMLDEFLERNVKRFGIA